VAALFPRGPFEFETQQKKRGGQRRRFKEVHQQKESVKRVDKREEPKEKSKCGSQREKKKASDTHKPNKPHTRMTKKKVF
jgi:hypothetical protein